jgi:hypothetical protein
MDGLGSPRPPAALIFVTETASATCGERRVSRFSRTQVCSRNYGRLPARLFGVDIEAARTCGRAWRKAPSFPSPAWQKFNESPLRCREWINTSEQILLSRRQHPHPRGDDRERMTRARQAAEALFTPKRQLTEQLVFGTPHWPTNRRANRACWQPHRRRRLLTLLPDRHIAHMSPVCHLPHRVQNRDENRCLSTPRPPDRRQRSRQRAEYPDWKRSGPI